MQIIIDSSVLVGILTPRDKWHSSAVALWQAIEEKGYTPLYLDCVLSEAISVTIRRLYEKNYTSEINQIIQRVEKEFPADNLTWVLTDVPRLYPDILRLMKETGGELNFHDALIALACRERGIPAIASFDADFDRLPWLRRLAQPADVLED